MRILGESRKLDEEIELVARLHSNIERRATRLLAYLLHHAVPQARYLGLIEADADDGSGFICGPVMDPQGGLLLDGIAGMEEQGDLESLVGVLSPDGDWMSACVNGAPEGAIWLDVTLALAFELEGDEQ